ncbi:MAG: AbrB/MazE/SpoVT family DNA-binding domain-containing protein [Candidatus Babeliaceae bacterium]|jgi:antitoxin component of MazEF toxin-antitoxin module
MLKKLVKYGNSNALVFDKAILELLNISEGSVLKIRTDGVSLILTPHVQQKNIEEKISPTITHIDAVQDSVIDCIIKQYNLSPQNRDALIKELKELYAQRKALIEKTWPAYRDFAQKKEALLQKYNVTYSPEFHEECVTLQNSLIPEIAKIEDQLLNFEKNHNLNNAQAIMRPDMTLKQTIHAESMEKLKGAYADLAKKHAEARTQLASMAENPDAIHELQLMTEKSGGNLNVGTLEYATAYNEIRYKYAPKARAMDEEMTRVAKEILCGKSA